MASIITFHHPTTILVAGPTFSGKTTFVKKFIRTRMVQPAPERIIWIYKVKDDKTDNWFLKLARVFQFVWKRIMYKFNIGVAFLYINVLIAVEIIYLGVVFA